MTRGNQREQDRLKAQKKAAASSKGKPKQSTTSLAQRREQDAEIVRQKMAVRCFSSMPFPPACTRCASRARCLSLLSAPLDDSTDAGSEL